MKNQSQNSKIRSQSKSRSQISGIETRIPISTPDQDQKQLDGELRKEVQIAWPSLDQKQLDELITPQTEHPHPSQKTNDQI